jgi:hypothetical protein
LLGVHAFSLFGIEVEESMVEFADIFFQEVRMSNVRGLLIFVSNWRGNTAKDVAIGNIRHVEYSWDGGMSAG